MPFDLKDVRGGGLHYVTDLNHTEGQIFRGGLRHYPTHQQRIIKGKVTSPNERHDKIDYQRGAVVHSRSSSNQFLNFHFLYGGFKKYFVDRWIIGHHYRKHIRKAWIPALFWFTVCCYNMRLYDNAAYNFFYFSD